MKSWTIKIFAIISIILAHNILFGQYKYGIQGGMGVSDFIGKDYLYETDAKKGITASFFYEYEINLTLSFAFELGYEQKGAFYKHIPREATELVVDTRTGYMSSPIMIKAYFGRKAEFYIYAGLAGSRLINESVSHSVTEYGWGVTDVYYNYKLNKWDASVIAGFGFNVYDIILDIRYHHGIVNIYEGTNSPNVRNHFLSATIGYTLFKRKVNKCFNSR